MLSAIYRDWRLCVSRIDLCLYILDSYATEPWYLGILSYPLPCISYCWPLQHVRANKASLQTLSVPSLLVLPLQLLRVEDQQQRYRPEIKLTKFQITPYNLRWACIGLTYVASTVLQKVSTRVAINLECC